MVEGALSVYIVTARRLRFDSDSCFMRGENVVTIDNPHQQLFHVLVLLNRVF